MLEGDDVGDSEISIWSDFKVCYNIIEIEIESSVRNCKKAEMAIWPFQEMESHDLHVSSGLSENSSYVTFTCHHRNDIELVT